MVIHTLITRKVLYTLLIGIFFATLYSCSSLYTKSACIIIHGTWAQKTNWYRPSGDFFQAVESCNNELQIVDEIISFSWSGKLGYSEQLKAAYELQEYIKKYDWVIFIAHSHGATVGMICSQILAENISVSHDFVKIKRFYSLGVPVDETVAAPQMDVVEKFYNIFSFGDFVQTVNGSYKRVFQNDRVANISIQLNDLYPDHSQLHHPAIGKDILKIENYYFDKKIGNFENFDFLQPSMICFYNYQHPTYNFDLEQSRTLQIDEEALRLTTLALFRGKVDENLDP